MIFEVNGDCFIIDYKHDLKDKRTLGILYTYNRGTKEKNEIYATMALCHTKDQYNKDKGRRIILDRIALLFGKKKEREMFYHQYFIQTNKSYRTKK